MSGKDHLRFERGEFLYSAARRLVQAREPTTSMIVVDIPAIFDRANTINNSSGLIKFKRHLGQLAEIAVRIRAHDERNLRFGEPDFDCLGHQTCSRIRVSF